MTRRGFMLSVAALVAGLALPAKAGPLSRYARPRIVVDVRDFGAVGDHDIDDTAAVQAALDSDADLVFFPPGIYQINGAPLAVYALALSRDAARDFLSHGKIFTEKGSRRHAKPLAEASRA